MTTGTYIAILGIDGSGKTTLAEGLRRHFAASGREVVDAGAEAVLTAARECDGHPWQSIDAIATEGWRLFLDSPRQSGLLTSALLEFAGHHLIRAEVIDPAVARGAVVISDSPPFKNVLKTLRQAELMPGSLSAGIPELVATLSGAMAGALLRPDIGLLLDVDPELAYERRLAQHGRLEAGADLAVLGRPGEESFLELQGQLRQEYRDAAREWGWRVLPGDARATEEVLTDALDHVRLALHRPETTG